MDKILKALETPQYIHLPSDELELGKMFRMVRNRSDEMDRPSLISLRAKLMVEKKLSI